ncbi:MAG: prepilin-type N-terminal cleavage/methylation domain-containing protein, partial [Puniceicoccales bacterium]|nr:prepilin-type N-terminal cleavage/methylation domain-containing protein [Puniceicoccales bacterium]
MASVRQGCRAGFSLLELLVVSVLLLTLILLVLPPWTRVAGRWSRQREVLRLAEEKERLFQRLQGDWDRLACHPDDVGDDFQILDSGTQLVLSSRSEGGQPEYVLWARGEAKDWAVYRSTSGHSEESLA